MMARRMQITSIARKRAMFEGLIKSMFAEHQGWLAKIPPFLQESMETMAHVRAQMKIANERLDAIDSKLQTLLNGPSTVTPELHDDVSKWASVDPRNAS
jgi:hypothetical protein